MTTRKLLEGIRVIDFTWHLTGPLTTKHLSDLGAEVIKIESRRRPDMQGSGDRSGGFKQFHTGKLSVTLNVTLPQGLELAKRLIATADIVTDNFAGGVMERLGLGYDEVRKIKPDIIMLSSCMQGQTGPHSRHPGSGHKLTALTGFNQITGWPDQGPVYLAAYTDFVAPRFNIIALMAALEYRRRTGRGQFLDMSQYESGIQYMAPLVLDYGVNGRVPGREGNRVPNAAPHNAYRCLGFDRWCAIAVFTDEEWGRFCDAIGTPGLADDPRFATLRLRKRNEAELDALVNEWTFTRTAQEVMDIMQRNGIAAGVVADAEYMMDKDPQFRHRRTFRELAQPRTGVHRTPIGTRFLLSKYEVELEPAPLLGQHNEYVFKELLGVPGEEYDHLVEEGVIN